jgi:hypothetical protein
MVKNPGKTRTGQSQGREKGHHVKREQNNASPSLRPDNTGRGRDVPGGQ